MRCLLLAFSLGIVMLQQQASLPSPWQRPEIVERYVAAGVHNYRTDYDGALTFTFDKGASHLPRRERAHDARYWRDAPVEGELASLA